MSNRHTKKRLFCLFALFVLLSQFTSGCIEIRRTDSPETMSAMQAKDIVDEYIQWDDNYTVSHIRKGGMVSEDGESECWFVVYSLKGNIGEMVDTIEYKVYIDDVIEIPRSKSKYVGDVTINWSIDSPEALAIARNNEHISEWLSKYKRATIETMSFGLNREISPDPIWGIHWSYSGGIFGDPVHAEIIINARNGEVIEVDADI